MALLLRKAIGLIAAYAIGMQALLTSVLTAAYGNHDPFSIICTSADSGDPGSLPQHGDHDCDACILTCGAATPTLAPSSATILPMAFFGLGRQLTLWSEALPSRSRHQPQASRAPPLLF
jgi:hypothetical protein